MTSGFSEAHPLLVAAPESLRRALDLARRALRAADSALVSPDPDRTSADDTHGSTLSAEIMSGGEPVARIVVRDTPDRHWSDDDKAILRDLGETLSEELRLKECIAQLQAELAEVSRPKHDTLAAPETSIQAPAIAAVATAGDGPLDDEHVDDERPHAEPLDPASLRILLADDLDLNRKLICDMLSLDGYVVDSVADGAAAVEAAKATAYDLILMDMIMPGMDGLDATRAIRALPAPACDVAIVALTAHSFREQLDNCLDAGMNATLTKPMSFDALSSAVSEWAGRRNAA